MMPVHHPDTELLLDYAAGGGGEVRSLILATHLALCAQCRRAVAAYEAAGGALFGGEADGPAEAGLEALLARLDAPASPAPARPRQPADPVLPQPLLGYLPGGLAAVEWRGLSRGVQAFPILAGPDGARAALLRIAAGRAVPRHGHRGNEATLVLQGGYDDEGGTFVRGDIELADGAVVHRPHAHAGEDCVCLAVLDGSLHLAGPLGRFFDRFIRL